MEKLESNKTTILSDSRRSNEAIKFNGETTITLGY